MLQPVVRWMRVVLPRGEILLIPAGIVVLMEVVHGLATMGQNQPAAPEGLSEVRLFVLSLCSLLYGVLRAGWFHPALDADYRRWLELTPWVPKQALPAGPLTLVPQDLAVIAMLIGLHHELTPLLILLPIAFLFGYLAMMMAINRLIGEWQLAYTVAFELAALPLLIDPVPRLEYVLALEIMCYFPTYWAIQRGLHRFPWKLPELFDGRSFKIAAEQIKDRKLGWPFDVLTAEEPQLRIPRSDGICLSLLAGWLELTMLISIKDELGQMMFRGLIGYAIAFSSFFFAAKYFENHRSPISFIGRVLTGRWIIPGFDRIWLIPLATGALAFTANLLLPTYWNCVGLTGYLLVMLVVGPHLERWRLVGNHRAHFMWNPATGAKDFIEL